MRILLVEDNLDLGDAVESKLRNAGHSIQWVRDGQSAVQWGRAEPWDALVLDINLPGKDGCAILLELEARLRALMRRPSGQTSSAVAYGNLTLDTANRSAEVNGEVVELGRREFR